MHLYFAVYSIYTKLRKVKHHCRITWLNSVVQMHATMDSNEGASETASDTVTVEADISDTVAVEKFSVFIHSLLLIESQGKRCRNTPGSFTRVLPQTIHRSPGILLKF